MEMCACCCGDVQCDKLHRVCDNGSCVRMCDKCITRWFDQFKKGHVVYAAHALCPFCKQKPRREITLQFANHMKTLNAERVAGKIEQHVGHHVVWCAECGEVDISEEKGGCADT